MGSFLYHHYEFSSKDEIVVGMDYPVQVTIFDSSVSVYIFLHYVDLSLMT